MGSSEKHAIITGIAGGLARLLGRRMQERGYQIIGVDYRPLRVPLDYPATVYQANYNKTRIEDIFRRHPPTHVLHLGRVGNLKERINKRFDLNVIGSRKVMDLSARYGARRLVILSTFHIYGAHPHNHIPIYEDDPIRSGPEFPQIADAIQLDNQALAWLYHHRECPAVLLRPTNVIGPNTHNAMSRFLRAKRVGTIVGFDPMVQFIHQDDITSAILATLESEIHGVFNVAGKGSLPWREALEVIERKSLPVPSSLAAAYLHMAGIISSQLPPYLINFFKYPCIISDEAFRNAFGWAPEVDQERTLRTTVGLA